LKPFCASIQPERHDMHSPVHPTQNHWTSEVCRYPQASLLFLVWIFVVPLVLGSLLVALGLVAAAA